MSNKLHALVQQDLKEYSDKHKIVIYVFGSYAKGTSTESSDLDLLLELEDSSVPAMLLHIDNLTRLITTRYAIELDILFSTQVDTKFIGLIKKEAIKV